MNGKTSAPNFLVAPSLYNLVSDSVDFDFGIRMELSLGATSGKSEVIPTLADGREDNLAAVC